MIEYIKGQLAELTPALAVVEAAGVGYALNISLTTYSGIQGKKEVKLYVHEALTTGGRDDSFTLFGFVNKQERELYRLLMLSSMNPTELCNAIANGDERMIKAVKGIGLKTAQRIIVDLRDKIMASGIANELHVRGEKAESTLNNAVKEEAVAALTMLGFSPAPVAKVVVSILQKQANLPVEQVVKEALKLLK